MHLHKLVADASITQSKCDELLGWNVCCIPGIASKRTDIFIEGSTLFDRSSASVSCRSQDTILLVVFEASQSTIRIKICLIAEWELASNTGVEGTHSDVVF